MKTILRWLMVMMMVLFICGAAPMRGLAQQTGLTWGPFYNTSGQPITNAFSVYSWPIQNQWVTIGTNVIWEGYIYTNNPNGSGYFTNLLWPGFYAVKVPALGNQVFFYANVPSTGIQIPISSCMTNTVQFLANASTYNYATNLLGFGPATNNYTGIVFALGFAPATNSTALMNLAAGKTILVTNSGVISEFDAAGNFWRSNMVTGTTMFYDTNGDFSSVQTNGVQVAYTNGTFAITSNTVPWGTFSAAQFTAAQFTGGITNPITGAQMPKFIGDVTNASGTNLTLAIVAPGGAAGSAAKVNYDAKGRVTGTNSLAASDLPSALNLETFTAGANLQTNATWPPPGIPLYTGTLTNWMLVNSNGMPGLLCTNLGGGTLTFLPLP